MNKNKLFEEELINAVDLEAAPPTEEPERQYYYIAKARKYVKELSEKLGRPLFAHVTTFGCQMNAQGLRESWSGILELHRLCKEEPDDGGCGFCHLQYLYGT